MSDGRKCSVYLPNERKLELTLQSKLLGKDLLDIVASHFKLKEKEYFGIAYKTEGGYFAWLQDEKKVLEHEIARKSGRVIDLQFAIKFYVESISHLKQSKTIELYFLHVKSLVYKGQLEIEDSRIAFKLASFILQAICGDYVDDATALAQLTKLPLLPSRVLREHPKHHCETSVIDLYKQLNGWSKGKAIISYMTLVETLPTYGIHYYKVKDKSGISWWLGLSYKGIQQFHISDRIQPAKTFHWRQLENLYFREKKFSIEVNDRQQRVNSIGSRDHLSTEDPRKSSSEVKVHAWYGSPALIKTIWSMSIAQHHYYLDRKQSKTKLNSSNNLTNLSNDLTSNSQSLITPLKDTPVMTRKQIKDVDVTVKKGSKDETPEVRAAKQEMSDALKTRRTELEDRLYDKVQELKKLCLQEAEIIGKLPPEYIRYMDPNEKRPKIKKRIGAEFKVKLRNKTNSRNYMERDYPATVTAASSSSSGFSSEATDASDELSQLETEFEILTQIASAAKKLAYDPTTKGRMRNKRLNSYKKSIEKLQTVEGKINVLRKKCGQKPSDRASMLIDESTDMIFEDGVISFRDGTESERSSMSDGLLLDDDMSLSSGGDALSTHSTPAVLNQSRAPASAMMQRRNRSPADVDINEVLAMKRSVTPPPSFERPGKGKDFHSHQRHAELPPTPEKYPSVDESKTLQPPPRNWISVKWDYPTKSRSKQGWHESSLDSIETNSTTSRLSEDTRSPEQRDISPSHSLTGSKIKLSHPLDPSLAQKVDLDGGYVDYEGRLSANSNQNNHNVRVTGSTENVLDSFNMTKLQREVSETALSELSTKSTPIITSPADQDQSLDKQSRLPKIEESTQPSQQSDRFRKRSSSFTESSNNPSKSPHRPAIRKKPLYQKHIQNQLQGAETKQYEAYNVPQAVHTAPDHLHAKQHGQSAQDLPPQFDTNLNIRMQYLTRSSGQLSLSTPVNPAWTQANNPQAAVRPPPLTRQHSGPMTVTHSTQKPVQYTSKRNDQQMHGNMEQYQKQGYHGYNTYQSQNQGQSPNFDGQSKPQYMEPPMSETHRDYYNNAVYQDIGMGWVPSIYEYSSRASVCESASAQSKKEDIRRVLENHIATKKKPSVAGSIRGERQTDSGNHPRLPHSTSEQTWAEYQKHLLAPGMAPSQRGSSPSEASSHSRANIFQHKPPPNGGKSPNDTPLLLYKTQRQPKLQHQKSVPVTAPEPVKSALQHHYNTVQHQRRTNQKHEQHQQILLLHYMQHDARDPLDHARNHVIHAGSDVGDYPSSRQQHFMSGLSSVPVDQAASRPPPHRWHSDDARLLPGNGPPTTQAQESGYKAKRKGPIPKGQFRGTEAPQKSPESGQDTVVIQKLTMSPEGHTVSAFSVTKSAPNTPLPPRQDGATFFGDSSDEDLVDDSLSDEGGDTGTLKSVQRHQSADDLLSASRDVGNDVRPLKTPTIIVHTPSFKSRIKPSLVPHGPINMDSSRKEPIRDENRSRGRTPSRGQGEGDLPKPPPRVKRAQSRSRKAAEAKETATKPPERAATSPAKSQKRPESKNSNRNKDVNSNEIFTLKQPTGARPRYSPTAGQLRSSPSFVDSPPRGTPSPPVVVYSSGTLPRASKARRKPDRAPPSGPSPARANLTLDVASDPSRERKSRRNSLIGHYLHEQNPASAPTTPTGSPRKHGFSPRRGPFPGPIMPARLSAHHRSKSEAWKVGANGVPQQILPQQQAPYSVETLPHPHHAHMQEYYNEFAGAAPVYYQSLERPNHNPNRYRTETDIYDRNRQRQRHQLSASAEDLLWNDTNDNQAGTLV
uniref:Uncharacterized protein LOC100175529 n=1 Tax=Phallusia mammillata TaxID=59560 RepID=A0A6F9DGI3_9ASCI|nr:uncharacterized protein LOC100175529 [Phallusia mammillata]